MAAYFVYLPRIGNYQKTGEVVLVCFDTFLQHLHAVTLGSSFGADGGVSFQVFPLDDFGAEGSIFSFHYFHFRVLGKELAALHQCDRVGVDFRQIVPVLVGQADKAV